VVNAGPTAQASATGSYMLVDVGLEPPVTTGRPEASSDSPGQNMLWRVCVTLRASTVPVAGSKMAVRVWPVELEKTRALSADQTRTLPDTGRTATATGTSGKGMLGPHLPRRWCSWGEGKALARRGPVLSII